MWPAVFFLTWLLCGAEALHPTSHPASVPAKDTIPSMFLSNWKNLVLTWLGPRDNRNEAPKRNPGIVAYRTSSNWSRSSITEDSFLLRVGPNGVNPRDWPANAALDVSTEGLGAWVEHFPASARPPGIPEISISRTVWVVPYEDFYLVEYALHNAGAARVDDVQILDYVITDDSSVPPGGDISARRTQVQEGAAVFVATLGDEEEGGVQMGMGMAHAYGVYSSFQVGPSQGEDSALQQFQDTGVLHNNESYEGPNPTLGMVFSLSLDPRTTYTITVFRTTCDDRAAVLRIARSIWDGPLSSWLAESRLRVTKWLDYARTPEDLEGDALDLYRISLLTTKHSQNPTVGTFVASFHPSYGGKTWSRDALFSCMIMDAAGYHEEAEMFLIWMSEAVLREDDSAFHTCYDHWTGKWVGFVEPQFDPMGAFLLATYHHFLQRKSDILFLEKVRSRVRSVEDFFLNDDSEGQMGFGRPDYSIWEESSDHHSGLPKATSYFAFSQSLAWAGLYSAFRMEETLEERGDQKARPSVVRKRADMIQSAIEKHLWMEDRGYYARFFNTTTNTPDPVLDAATTATVFLGLVDNEDRARSHVNHVVANLTRGGAGIARYWGDPYFYDSRWNPGGQELTEPTAPWGVTTMFTAWAEMRLGSDVSDRLQWMIDRTAYGLMPVGEAIDAVTGNFVMTATPDVYEHAGVYVWTHLMRAGLAWPPDPTRWDQKKDHDPPDEIPTEIIVTVVVCSVLLLVLCTTGVVWNRKKKGARRRSSRRQSWTAGKDELLLQ